MSKAAKRARNAAVIELLCERFPQTFNRGGPQPLKVGVYADALAALGDTVQLRDLKSALGAKARWAVDADQRIEQAPASSFLADPKQLVGR